MALQAGKGLQAVCLQRPQENSLGETLGNSKNCTALPDHLRKQGEWVNEETKVLMTGQEQCERLWRTMERTW